MTLLDWHHAAHWSPVARCCYLCGQPTHLQTFAGTPAHKVCEEQRIDREAMQLPTCPRCDQPPGRCCITRNGRPRTDPHAARTATATSAWAGECAPLMPTTQPTRETPG